MSEQSLSDTPMWEKVVGLIGLVIITLTLLSLTASAIMKDEKSADFVFDIREITQISNGYLVRVEVENTGDLTAESFQLEGRLTIDGAQEESVFVVVDYFAPKATQEFRFYFRDDPRAGDLNFYPRSFKVP